MLTAGLVNGKHVPEYGPWVASPIAQETAKREVGDLAGIRWPEPQWPHALLTQFDGNRSLALGHSSKGVTTIGGMR